MNIKEIAELAGVSVSTVSKVINGKDSNISRETRDRVMKVVKECNYTPYAGVHTLKKTRSFLLGVMLSKPTGHELILSGIVEAAKINGYTTVLFSADTPEEEYKGITMLCSHNLDGIIWDKLTDSYSKCESQLIEHQVPYFIIDCYNVPSPERGGLDYSKLAYNATQALVKNKHQKIGCLIKNNGIRERRFQKGFEQCLFDNKLPFDANMLCVVKESSLDISALIHNYTGIICFDTCLAAKIYQHAEYNNIKIPRDISLVSLVKDPNEIYLLPKLSSIRLPFYELGEYACRRLIAKVEKTRVPEIPFKCDQMVESESSIDVPITVRNKKIVVVGAINMDTLLNLGQVPQIGETITTKKRATIPGGKGVNQAIGAAKLGAEVYLIGKLGKDYEASILYDFLKINNVNIEGVSTSTVMATGHAYVYVKDNGESAIVVYEGANNQLSPKDIEMHRSMFDNASFCLLQTEINPETVECAAKTARKCGAKVILKPCAVTSISDGLIKNVDIFMPNRNEIEELCQEKKTLEEKAQHFLDLGAKHVIVTLDRDGCYLRDKKHSKYFEAADFEAVDTTGAADAFAATLAVYLSKNYDICTSIKYATYAAGFSITTQGVPPALVDKSTLDLLDI